LNYCSQCGTKVTLRKPAGDDRLRFMCDGCGTIHYENPKMVVGTIPVAGDTILLCRRAIEPRRNSWTLPAGWLENGETLSACATRETMEEAWAIVEDLQPYVLINLPFINQLYFIYRARLTNQDFHAGSESLEVKLFSPAEIPWDELAFSAIHETLKCYCKDLQKAEFPFRILAIDP
jgi:ADP-ribose pyrophosphatase YjhB (NUDIX family)